MYTNKSIDSLISNEDEVTRREFLKTAGLGIGALLTIPSSGFLRDANAQVNSQAYTLSFYNDDGSPMPVKVDDGTGNVIETSTIKGDLEGKKVTYIFFGDEALRGGRSGVTTEKQELEFPHIAVGGNYQTKLELSPAIDVINGVINGISGIVTIESYKNNGTIDSLITEYPSKPGHIFVIPFENTLEQNTGIAISNSKKFNPVNLTLRLYENDGSEYGRLVSIENISLPPRGHFAGFPEQLFRGEIIPSSGYVAIVSLSNFHGFSAKINTKIR